MILEAGNLITKLNPLSMGRLNCACRQPDRLFETVNEEMI
jgi:hypothetical protein